MKFIWASIGKRGKQIFGDGRLWACVVYLSERTDVVGKVSLAGVASSSLIYSTSQHSNRNETLGRTCRRRGNSCQSRGCGTCLLLGLTRLHWLFNTETSSFLYHCVMARTHGCDSPTPFLRPMRFWWLVSNDDERPSACWMLDVQHRHWLIAASVFGNELFDTNINISYIFLMNSNSLSSVENIFDRRAKILYHLVPWSPLSRRSKRVVDPISSKNRQIYTPPSTKRKV